MAELSVHPSESLVITRTLAAPRELVFRAFTEAERLGRWWGPKGLKIEVQRLDLRPGGLFHYAMVHPDGTRWWGRFEFREISPPQRLIWINSFSDPDGGLSRPPFAPGLPAPGAERGHPGRARRGAHHAHAAQRASRREP